MLLPPLHNKATGQVAVALFLMCFLADLFVWKRGEVPSLRAPHEGRDRLGFPVCAAAVMGGASVHIDNLKIKRKVEPPRTLHSNGRFNIV